MSAALQFQASREQLYSQLQSKSLTTVSPNHEWLTCIMASWCSGQGILPDYLGLEPEQFTKLKKQIFSGCCIPDYAQSGSKLNFEQMLEKDDLVNLLRVSSRPDNLEVDWIIGILVAGCLGSDHLWQDLGLWSRPQLSAMLHYNFPKLAAKNNQDMKWKKFLYKQLCEADGSHLCRAPSCNVCVDYSKCFGSET
jgi:nitrogen fixation protein NifQ